MKSTISDIRQLFNVKKIVDADTELNKLKPGELAIVNRATGKVVKPSSYDDLPSEFGMVYNHSGKMIYSFEPVIKDWIRNVVARDYKEPKEEIWEGQINSCSSITSARLVVNYDSTLVNNNTTSGFDFFVEVAPEEFACYCSCSDSSVYQTDVMTMLLVKKAIENNNGIFKVFAKDSENTEYTDIKSLKAYVESKKEVNTDEDKGNDTKPLKIVVKSIIQPAGTFIPEAGNYLYGRSVNLNPVVVVNDTTTCKFEKTQEGIAEIGIGADLKFEEYQNYNFYTTNNFVQYIEGKSITSDYTFMFEDEGKYKTVTFEYFTNKSKRNGEGDKKSFVVLLGTSDNGVWEELKQLFVKQ